MVDQQRLELEINNLRTIIFLFTFSILFLSCENSHETIANFIETDYLADEDLKFSNVYYTENGNLKIKVSSDKMSRFSEDDILELSGNVKIDFYTSDGLNKRSILRCASATINNMTNIMQANKDVLLTDGENKQLSTEELIWDRNTDLIYTDLDVMIKTKDEIVFASGFESTPDFLQYEIKNPKGSFNLEKD